MSVSLSIAFTGLCALLADGSGAPGQVLLLDAKGVGRVGGVILPAHAPTLVVSLNDLANPASSRPTRVIAGAPGRGSRLDQVGLWDLTGSEVRIRAQGAEGTGLQLFRPSDGATSWPEAPANVNDPAAWRDLRFVPSMKALVGDGRIAEGLAGTAASTPGALPRSVAARIHLEAGLLEGAIPSQEAFRDDVFQFGAGSQHVRQALTDTVQWSLQTSSTAVVIDIIPVAGGPARRLLFAPSAKPHRLYVSNLPVENPTHADTHHEMSDDEMNAVHFGAYYALLENQPAEKPLPKRWHDHPGRKGAGFLRTSFCPPAMFSLP